MASDDVLRILEEEKFSVDVNIIRHCFVGSYEEGKQWLTEFPNTYFSLPPKVLHGNTNQVHESCRTFYKSVDLT